VTEPTIPAGAAFQIKLPEFEGPLDLLLHLIKKHELDILDLPVAFVTECYLDYLQAMQELDLDMASEYLLMAATLVHIKSKMLLPQATTQEATEEQDEGYQEDPRAELIRRLLEYQKYKAVADQLGARPLAGRDVFPRGMPAPAAQGPAQLAAIDMYKLLDAFQSILKRVQGRAALEVTAERVTIQERMTQISDLLRVKRACTFDELFEFARTRYDVVVTFLALLEMTKLRMTRIFQTDPQSTLHVQYALLDDESAGPPPGFVDEYGSGQTAPESDDEFGEEDSDLASDDFGEEDSDLISSDAPADAEPHAEDADEAVDDEE